MNARLRSAASLVLVAFAAVAQGQDKDDKTKLLLGSWEVTKAEDGVVPRGTILEFTKDGKIKMTGKYDGTETTRTGTYTLAGDKLTLVLQFEDMVKTLELKVKKVTEKDLSVSTENGKGKSVEFKKK